MSDQVKRKDLVELVVELMDEALEHRRIDHQLRCEAAVAVSMEIQKVFVERESVWLPPTACLRLWLSAKGVQL